MRKALKQLMNALDKVFEEHQDRLARRVANCQTAEDTLTYFL
jgi:hypothetical protein